MYRNRLLLFLGIFLFFNAGNAFSQSYDSVLGPDTHPYAHKQWSIEQPAEIKVYIFLLETCVISQYYTLVLNHLESEYRDHKISFVGLFPNKGSSLASIDAFATKFGLDFNLRLDPQHDYVSQLGATVTPEVFVYDERNDSILYRGRIDDAYFRVGKKRPKTRKHDLQDALHAIVNHQPVEVQETDAVGCFINRKK